jgi:hypothetical protein
MSNAVTGWNGDTEAGISKSQQISYSIYDENNNYINVKNLSKKIELWIPRDTMATVDPFKLINATNLQNKTNDTQIVNGFYTSFFSLNGSNVSLNFQIQPTNKSIGYLLFIKYGSSAVFNKNYQMFDLFKCFCPNGEKKFFFNRIKNKLNIIFFNFKI